MEVLAALLGVETWDEVRAKLDEQSEPDITMYLRSGLVYALRADGAELERLYEDMRDAANRALPVDEAMTTINGKLRRELDTATALLRDWAADVSQDPNRQVPAQVIRFLRGESR